MKKNTLKPFAGALDRGLEGVIVSSTELSTIENSRLFVRGFSLEDLAQNSSYEEIAFLLLQGGLPHQKEWGAWRQALQKEFYLTAEEISALSRLPYQNVHPMAWLRTALSTIALALPEPDFQDPKALCQAGRKLLAKTPLIIALLENLRQKRNFPPGAEGKEDASRQSASQKTSAPNGAAAFLLRPDQSLAFNFLYLLQGKPPSLEEAKAMDVCLILHAEHDFNCSSFSARVTASSLSDVFSAIVSAVGTLKGPLHGGANEKAFDMLHRLSSEEEARMFVRRALAKKEKIMGFGHRIYREKDPRAQILKSFAKNLTREMGKEQLYKISVAMENEVREAKGLPANVDFYSASVYHCLKIPTDLFTPIFAMSRMAGWLAHIFEQYKNNRIYRPQGQWKGQMGRKWRPLHER